MLIASLRVSRAAELLRYAVTGSVRPAFESMKCCGSSGSSRRLMTSAPPHLLAIGERVGSRLERDLTAEIERWSASTRYWLTRLVRYIGCLRWEAASSGVLSGWASLRQVAASLMPKTLTGVVGAGAPNYPRVRAVSRRCPR